MGKEIERKYLVKQAEWRSHKAYLQTKSQAIGEQYRQGYIPTNNGTTVRLRIIGEQGYLTIKSKTRGYSRSEFEYSIPLQDAQEMLDTLCVKPLIEKIRYKINHDNVVWEVDEFSGENEGLIIAEVELENEEQQVNIPHWIEREVQDKRYFNSSLVKYPYSQWHGKS